MESIYNDLKQRQVVFQSEMPSTASYIMPDGLFLNIVASKERTSGHGWHSDIDQLYSPVVQDHIMISDNAIKIQTGVENRKECICVPKTIITKDQIDSLELVLCAFIKDNKQFRVYVTDFKEYNEVSVETKTAKGILKEITKLLEN